MSGSVSMVDGHIDPGSSRMTDKEIIRALECCSEENKCQQCPYYNKGNFKCLNYKFFKDLLDLINRQQAEIERLSHKCEDCAGCTSWKCDCANERAEAIKEFVRKLLALIGSVEISNLELRRHVNNLVKEMAGE